MKRVFSIVVLMVLVLAVGALDLYAGGMGKQPRGGMMLQSSSENGPLEYLPRASELIGMPVTDHQGQRLGEVTDLILNSDGRVTYIVISGGGAIGFGEKMSAIPWRAANPRVYEKSLVVDVSQERFLKAPSFANWEDFREGTFTYRDRTYYGKELSSGTGTAKPMGTMSK
jgi:hypothetical protein